jgi:isopentenyl phosphate kinase
MIADRARHRPPVCAIKLGGSLITDRRAYRTVRGDALERCARAVACWVTRREAPVIVVLGGGSFGHHVVEQHRLSMDGHHRNPPEVFALTAALFDLKAAFSNCLARHRVASLPLQETGIFRVNGRPVTGTGLWAIDACLRGGYVPVLTGGLLVHRGDRFCPVSSDRMFLPLCKHFHIRRVAMFTDQAGVLRRGKVVARITQANRRHVLPHIAVPTRLDVTDGMRGKVDAALELARNGVETVITDGRHLDADVLTAAFGATPSGTLVERWKRSRS